MDFLVILEPVIIISYIMIIIYLTFKKLKRRALLKRKMRESFELLKNMLNNETAQEENIDLIFRKEIQPYYNLSFVDFLESFQIYILKTESPEFVLSHNEIIKGLIDLEKSDKPFDGVEEHEKRLLISIEESAQRGEVSNIPFTLSELARVLQSKEKEYRKLRWQNNWSIPIAVVGLILTVIFGLRPPQAKLAREDIDTIIVEFKKELATADTIPVLSKGDIEEIIRKAIKKR